MLIDVKFSVFLLFFFISFGGFGDTCLSTVEAKWTGIYFDLYLSLLTQENLYSDTFKDNGHLQGIIDLYAKNGQEVELAADEGAIYILRNANIDQSNLELALIKMTSDLEGEIDLNSSSGAIREYPSLGQRINIIKKTCQK